MSFEPTPGTYGYLWVNCYTVTVYCVPCNRAVKIDLEKLPPLKSYLNWRWACTHCNRPGQANLSPDHSPRDSPAAKQRDIEIERRKEVLAFRLEEKHMCNLYRVKTNQESIRDIVGIMEERLNLEPDVEVYPDRPAPVVRNGEKDRELVGLTWGMPSPQFVTQGKPDTGVTNIRNVTSPHWRRWLRPENRCVVPWTTFCEWEDTKPRKTKRWFALNEETPLAFFAGIWTDWHGVRGSMKNPREGDHQLFGFLTTDPNSVVKPIHPKAMPVILTNKDEVEMWLTAPWEEAKELQRPLPDDGLVLLPVEDEKKSADLFG